MLTVIQHSHLSYFSSKNKIKKSILKICNQFWNDAATLYDTNCFSTIIIKDKYLITRFNDWLFHVLQNVPSEHIDIFCSGLEIYTNNYFVSLKNIRDFELKWSTYFDQENVIPYDVFRVFANHYWMMQNKEEVYKLNTGIYVSENLEYPVHIKLDSFYEDYDNSQKLEACRITKIIGYHHDYKKLHKKTKTTKNTSYKYNKERKNKKNRDFSIV